MPNFSVDFLLNSDFQVCAHLVRPLLAMNHLLQKQTEQLGDLLARKDAEILDYKENGATLSRGTQTNARKHTHSLNGQYLTILMCACKCREVADGRL